MSDTNQYLTFTLDEEQYALSVYKVSRSAGIHEGHEDPEDSLLLKGVIQPSRPGGFPLSTFGANSGCRR
jgi:chemotaxis signal transduction protein